MVHRHRSGLWSTNVIDVQANHTARIDSQQIRIARKFSS
jgi:hypothetical protein